MQNHTVFPHKIKPETADRVQAVSGFFVVLMLLSLSSGGGTPDM